MLSFSFSLHCYSFLLFFSICSSIFSPRVSDEFDFFFRSKDFLAEKFSLSCPILSRFCLQISSEISIKKWQSRTFWTKVISPKSPAITIVMILSCFLMRKINFFLVFLSKTFSFEIVALHVASSKIMLGKKLNALSFSKLTHFRSLISTSLPKSSCERPDEQGKKVLRGEFNMGKSSTSKKALKKIPRSKNDPIFCSHSTSPRITRSIRCTQAFRSCSRHRPLKRRQV